jgi:uncharacterized cupin superfamily protein
VILRAVVPEAPLRRTEAGLVPAGEGWFVLNAREALWKEGPFGAYTRFEGEPRFPHLGVNVSLLWPGQPSCMYHREDEEQEDFLILSGEALLLVEGEERPLRAWDFVHCPPGTDHVFVGTGEGPCVILAMGTRTGGEGVYPAAEVALKHGAGVERETTSGDEAYAGFEPDVETPYRDGWLPDLRR